MDKKVSGFGYCSTPLLGHKYVSVYKNNTDQYYVKIDYVRSSKIIDSLDDIKGLWECVDEVERWLVEIQMLNERHGVK